MNGERCMRYQPKYIYVHFEGETWRIGDQEPGVYPLQAKSKIWLVNPELKVKVKRTGFCCVPDFAGTCHMYQGASLPAVIVDCLLHSSVTTVTEMMASYVGALFLHQGAVLSGTSYDCALFARCVSVASCEHASRVYMRNDCFVS